MPGGGRLFDMRIGIDARAFYPQRNGIANYVCGLVEQLPALAPEHEYFLYSHKEMSGPEPHRAFRRHVDCKFSWCPGPLWLWSRCGQFARRHKLDVFWSSTPALPLWVPRATLKVVTVYDLVWRRFPETMTKYNFWVQRVMGENGIRSCDRVIAISRATGDELTQILGVPPERIKLVYPCIFESYKVQDSFRAAEYISSKYGVSPRYMAAVGTIEPRKNLSLLVRVLQMLKKNGRLDCPLLIAGANGWRNSRLYQEVRESGLTEQEIRFLGYIPNEDLPQFYAGAQLFLFPSLYEGFGIPPLEAMACGTPVVASDAQPMPEVLGDAAILEPPSSAERFMEAIVRVLGDRSLHCAMRQRGLDRVRAFRWGATGRQLLEALTCG